MSPAPRLAWPLLLACSLLLAGLGCARDQERGSSTITVSYPGDERVFGPYWEMPAKFLVFLPLVALDERGELQGRLARRWKHSPDYRTWTIHLRTDVRWHDGVTVTAHDVKFTHDLFAHPDVLWDPPGSATLEVLNDSTYTVTYGASLADPLSTWRVYYPKHLLEKLPPKEFAQWEFWTHPVGNGPYRYVKHVPKTFVELEADSSYFGDKPRIQRVILKLTSNTGVTDLLSGEVDAAVYLSSTEKLKVSRDPRFAAYHEVYGAQLRAIAWNQKHPALKDPRVRRAFTLAINRRELLGVLDLPQNLPIADVLSTARQFRRGELLEPLPYDPARAVELLDAAGWTDTDGDGVRQRDGMQLSIKLLVSTEEEPEAIFVQAALRRIGARIDIDRLDLNLVRRRIRAGEFDAAIRTFDNELSGNFGQLKMFGLGSPIGYRNPRVRELLETAGRTLHPDSLDAIYRSLMPIFQADVPMTFLYPGVMHAAARRRVRGLSSPYRAEPTVWMEHLWLERSTSR
ncbi:MAG TPA: peptide ABC transporter substrate-binding protein [Gemmatimonadaceae bacterium]|nr:peptide ABC transporter substrate-binding protein [Gemmatimonadaceae bacterium]